jgi:hypothetical protein
MYNMNDINDEKKLFENMEKQAIYYIKKYKPVMENFESKSIKGRLGLVRLYDYSALGKMLESFDVVRKLCSVNESIGGTINAMGVLPQVAYGAISVFYGNSPISLISSVQQVPDAKGRVYFKTVKAATAKASVSDGDTFIDPRNIGSIPRNYASGKVADETLATGNGSATTFSATTDYYPIRGTVVVTLQDSVSTVYCQDNGDGVLLGQGVSGTVDYDSKVVALTFTSAPADSKIIYVSYNINYGAETTIPKIKAQFDSSEVTCFPFALGAEIDIYTQYSMQQRFGFSMKEDMAVDLANELTLEVMDKLIQDALANATVTDTYSTTPDTGVPDLSHRLFFAQKIIDVENAIAAAAGRGGITALIAGSTAASVIGGQPDFKDSGDKSKSGIQVYGTWKDKVVIKVNDANVLAANLILTTYNGANPFDASLYYAPYMPLMVTDLLPMTNPLRQQKGAASWSAQGSLIPNFIGQITIS